MADHKHTTTGTPTWWTDKHDSDWERVKGALERDWEQTKSDFSNSSGLKLNQNLADTLKQSVGSEPVPPLDEKTRPTDPKVAAKEAKNARESMVKESEKAAETVSKAHADIAEGHAKIKEAGARRDEAIEKWHDAEQEVRYGYSVRSQYPAGYKWDDRLEAKLQGEWDALHPVRSWNASKPGIHRGWDHAGKML